MNLQDAIRKRRTLKIMSPKPLETDKDISIDVQTIIEMGSKAPFHYPSPKTDSDLNSLAPWRFYILNAKECRKLAHYYLENGIEGGKIIDMLQAASTLIQVTWIPELSEDGTVALNLKNTEHIAATAAAVQNMLLTATDLGYENYWSSGGTLREDRFKKRLSIPTSEQLLASVFLFEKKLENVISKSGSLRGKQGEKADYSKQIVL